MSLSCAGGQESCVIRSALDRPPVNAGPRGHGRRRPGFEQLRVGERKSEPAFFGLPCVCSAGTVLDATSPSRLKVSDEHARHDLPGRAFCAAVASACARVHGGRRDHSCARQWRQCRDLRHLQRGAPAAPASAGSRTARQSLFAWSQERTHVYEQHGASRGRVQLSAVPRSRARPARVHYARRVPGIRGQRLVQEPGHA